MKLLGLAFVFWLKQSLTVWNICSFEGMKWTMRGMIPVPTLYLGEVRVASTRSWQQGREKTSSSCLHSRALWNERYRVCRQPSALSKLLVLRKLALLINSSFSLLTREMRLKGYIVKPDIFHAISTSQLLKWPHTICRVSILYLEQENCLHV